MKTIILYLILAVFSFTSQQLECQETSQKTKEEILQNKREEIINNEKEKLRFKIETINRQLENKVITAEEAEKRKKEAAELHAKNIENRIAIMENKYELDIRNDKEHSSTYIGLSEDGMTFRVNAERERKYDKRTTSDIVFAAGFNNALTEEQSLNDSDFKIGGSRFFEIGWAWKTRVFDNSNWLRLKYGFSFQFNGLKPTDNRYFVNNDGLVSLEEFDHDLSKSKFRTDYLVAPVHFEFGPSERHETERSLRFSTEDKFRIGLGGYAGFSLGERQKLKYTIDGDKKKDKLKGDYNTNDFIYGLSAYMGWGGATLYAKYDLNPLFADPNPEMHNFSLGIRFDVD
ncbi:hypothetical protein C7S20_01865 [Christiangramia fulva]|uniref:Outer membrane protein beta-barrel domain-containing protein n=1 Tax=Christiangramia fulva TaxID=2126553 RepID=A0A2R3ZAU5_9FLAO|nr:hypothetical protein [Christiangramia fulva]AVR47292.1 hypothetical protein C7S20_01865 [Christiangramia fulva]